MTIRARMTLWYAGILLVSALVIAALSVDELYEQHGKDGEVGESLADIIGLVCWIGIPAILLSVGGGAWMMRKALAPVAALIQAAEGINERNLSDHLPRTRNGDELDRLADTVFCTRDKRTRCSCLQGARDRGASPRARGSPPAGCSATAC